VYSSALDAYIKVLKRALRKGAGKKMAPPTIYRGTDDGGKARLIMVVVEVRPPGGLDAAREE
jgi:hypothetical protein